MYLKHAKTEHLSAFRETWRGRLRKNRDSGEMVRQSKSELGKQKDQEFVRMFFRRARQLRWIPENPAELLLSVKTPRTEVKKKTTEEKQQLLGAIPHVAQPQVFVDEIEVVVQAFVVVRQQIRLASVFVVPRFVGRAGLHRRQDANQPRMIAAFGQYLLDPIFLPHVAFPQKLDLDPVVRRQAFGILTQRVAEWLGEHGIVEDLDLSLVQIRCHALGKADLRQRAKEQYPVPEGRRPRDLGRVAFRQ